MKKVSEAIRSYAYRRAKLESFGGIDNGLFQFLYYENFCEIKIYNVYLNISATLTDIIYPGAEWDK